MTLSSKFCRHRPVGMGALLWCLLPTIIRGKRVSGDFKLSGVDSERVLTSFAVHPEFGARFQLNLTAAGMYETERFLKLRLYTDEDWNRHLKSLTCTEKVRKAVLSKDIAFDYFNKVWTLSEPIEDVILTAVQKAKYDPRKIIRNKRQTQRADGEKEEPPDEKVDDAFVSLEERNLVAKSAAFTATRPQYWYFAIDDCMLEQTNLDARVPMLHFDFQVVNALQLIDGRSNVQQTHLSADEMTSTRLHLITLLISGGTSFLLVMTAGLQTVQKKGGGNTIHAAVLWVALAAALDAGSSLCELIHLSAYQTDGIGSYFFDALAAHAEALCDSLLMLLLLGIGAGWTLPSDAVRFRPNENAIQRALADLASPLRALLNVGSSRVGMVSWALIFLHAILCQWGRTYNDDFESYHDLEHLPGKLLMMIRIALGVLLLVVTWRTHLQAKVQQLQSFYHKLAVVGFVWFQSLPFITWVCNTFVPFYMRHPTVYFWSAILQSSCIVVLAGLVTSHSKSSAFAQYSHMTAGNSNTSSLNDTGPLLGGVGGGGSAISSPSRSTYSLGKTKIAID